LVHAGKNGTKDKLKMREITQITGSKYNYGKANNRKQQNKTSLG